MKTIKEYVYYNIFKIIVKFDKFLERFIKEEQNNLGSTGINYTICTKGNKFHQSCKCGSTTGRC